MFNESGCRQRATGGSTTGQSWGWSSRFFSVVVPRPLWLFANFHCPPSINLPGLTSAGLWPTNLPTTPPLSSSREWMYELTSDVYPAATGLEAESRAGSQMSGRGRPRSYRLSLHHDTAPSSFSSKKCWVRPGQPTKKQIWTDPIITPAQTESKAFFQEE